MYHIVWSLISLLQEEEKKKRKEKKIGRKEKNGEKLLIIDPYVI
jgi:hypothetical protein